MRPASARVRGDDGSVLVLVLGLTGILLALVAVVVDVSAVILAKRAVASAADGAAATAAQQADEAAIRRDGVGAAVRLDPAQAALAVQEFQVRADRSQAGLQLRLEVDATATVATVTATRVVRLPFVGWFGIDPRVPVRAVASIRSPVSPPG